MIQNDKSNAPTAVVMWVMWFAFAGATVMYRIFLVGKSADTHSIAVPDTVFAWVLYVVPVVIVLSLRWLVIPSLRIPFLKLVPFVAGFAFAEALTFFGIFLFPKQFNFFYFTSWFLLLQLMPLWKTNQPSRS